MAKLVWGATGQRLFEAGVDRGVLYIPSQPAVAWNGLKAVNETISGGEPEPYYLDGRKFVNVATTEEFAATIEAFSAPKEFASCDGTKELANGLFVTQQPRSYFGLSYRSRLGNDVDATDLGYKIHLVYQATASPSDRANATMSNVISPLALSWAITTIPQTITNAKATAHLIVDSTKANPTRLATLELMLYGGPSTNGALPTPNEVVTILNP